MAGERALRGVGARGLEDGRIPHGRAGALVEARSLLDEHDVEVWRNHCVEDVVEVWWLVVLVDQTRLQLRPCNNDKYIYL